MLDNHTQQQLLIANSLVSKILNHTSRDHLCPASRLVDPSSAGVNSTCRQNRTMLRSMSHGGDKAEGQR